jgi:plastocyanin domain-containing protein
MKQIIVGIIVAVVLVVAAVFFLNGKSSDVKSGAVIAAGNVTVVSGVQIVDIKARGGYQPVSSAVKAGIPTTLRFETNGTFDCSSSIRIPSLGISKILPATGVTDIDVGTLQPGTLQGTCGMGMYRFEIDAQE